MPRSGRAAIAFIAFFFLFYFVTANGLLSQTHFQGKVVFRKDKNPAAMATVSVFGKDGSKVSMTDWAGNFRISMRETRSTDSVMISLVGYSPIRIPLLNALKSNLFELSENVRSLETVKVKSFNSQGEAGDMRESVGFFRSWNTSKNGSEIGRMIHIAYSEYKIDKIRFKVNNRCDSVLIRLHIRDVVNGRPGKELLTDSISVYVKRLANIDDKSTEFDLTERNIIMQQKDIFVTLEVIGCKPQVPGTYCSFSFAGTEKGSFFYKSRRDDEWEETSTDYTIFIRAAIRY